MRIGLEITSVYGDKGAKTRDYIIDLISALTEIDDKNEYFLYVNAFRRAVRQNILKNPLIKKDNVKTRFTWVPNILHNNKSFLDALYCFLLYRIFLPWQLKRDRVDTFLVLARDFFIPSKCHADIVLLAQDIPNGRIPIELSAKNDNGLNKRAAEAIKRAVKIIVGSKAAKDNLVRDFEVSKEKIKIIYKVVSNRFRPLNNRLLVEKICSKYHIEGKFILFVWNLKPKKNISNLIKAFYICQDKFKEKLQLVLAGENTQLKNEILLMVKALGFDKDLLFWGDIPQEELPLLYNAAELFLYPPVRYERWGKPLIEAMSCGTPIIASNRYSMLSIMRNAAILVESEDTESLAQSMFRVLSDRNVRGRMSAESFEAAKFLKASKILKLFKKIDISRKTKCQR